MRQSKAWQEVLQKNDWTDHFIAGPELDQFIDRETESNTEVLASIGLASDDQAVAQYAAVGPWAIPALIGIGLLISAAGALYERPGDRRPPLQLIDWRTGAAASAVLTLYVFLLNPIGYLLSTVVFLFIITRLLGSRRTVRDLIFSVVTSVIVYAFFNFVLKIGLPSGVLG
jgi:putative tricarboxylic transport membrane protein